MIKTIVRNGEYIQVDEDNPDYPPDLSISEQKVPSSVSNFQARAVMRQVFLANGKSLFTTVNDDLSETRAALSDRDDKDPEKIKAEIAWQAWEQANDYLRHGPLVMSLASKFGFDDDQTDALFLAASKVIA